MLNNRNIELCRSLLFTPAIQIDRFKKALLGEADVVCLDLEDGVAPSHKEMAREKAIPLLFGEIKPLTAVKALRINPIKTQTGMQDLLALCKFGQAPSVILLPKVDAPEEVLWVSEILDEVAYSDTKLFVIIETAKGLERAIEIANASPRISTLLFGAAAGLAGLGAAPAAAVGVAAAEVEHVGDRGPGRRHREPALRPSAPPLHRHVRRSRGRAHPDEGAAVLLLAQPEGAERQVAALAEGPAERAVLPRVPAARRRGRGAQQRRQPRR